MRKIASFCPAWDEATRRQRDTQAFAFAKSGCQLEAGRQGAQTEATAAAGAPAKAAAVAAAAAVLQGVVVTVCS
jgi:hypothetical protein